MRVEIFRFRKGGEIMNILMIEDNESVSEMLEMFFMKEDWNATFIPNGQEGLDTYMASPSQFDLLILDVMLPDLDGMAICREIRQSGDNVPIIMLTAKDTESDEVIGLELGADDYVTKPFSPLTLIARIKSIYRRAYEVTDTEVEIKQSNYEIETKHLQMDSETREVFLYGELLENLTPKEFDLLHTLASHPKRVFSREQLLQLVWNYEYFGDERTVDAHIKKLRQKLTPNGPQVIHTVWGVGYKFDDSEAKD